MQYIKGSIIIFGCFDVVDEVLEKLDWNLKTSP
mgnify:CR=1 FL=1